MHNSNNNTWQASSVHFKLHEKQLSNYGIAIFCGSTCYAAVHVSEKPEKQDCALNMILILSARHFLAVNRTITSLLPFKGIKRICRCSKYTCIYLHEPIRMKIQHNLELDKTTRTKNIVLNIDHHIMTTTAQDHRSHSNIETQTINSTRRNW